MMTAYQGNLGVIRDKFNLYALIGLCSFGSLFLCGCPQDSLPTLSPKSTPTGAGKNDNQVNSLIHNPTPKTSSPTPTNTPSPTPTVNQMIYFRPFGEMPLYSQHSTAIKSSFFPDGDPAESALCAPTAAAMILQSIVNKVGTSTLAADSWTLKHFLNTSETNPEARKARQIEAMATLMGTDILEGTSYPLDESRASSKFGDITKGTYDRKDDFKKNTVLGVFTPYNLPTSIHDFTDNRGGTTCCGLDKGFANMVIMGHYVAKKTQVLSQTFVTFSRDTRFGGHAVVVSGYTVDSAGATDLIINDPADGQIQFEPVDQLILNGLVTVKNNSFQIRVLPSGGKTQGHFSGYQRITKKVTTEDGLVYNAEPVFEIIEAYTGLAAPL